MRDLTTHDSESQPQASYSTLITLESLENLQVVGQLSMPQHDTAPPIAKDVDAAGLAPGLLVKLRCRPGCRRNPPAAVAAILADVLNP